MKLVVTGEVCIFHREETKEEVIVGIDSGVDEPQQNTERKTENFQKKKTIFDRAYKNPKLFHGYIRS